MTTAADWVHATRSLLMSGLQEDRNLLSAPYTAGSGTLVLAHELAGIVAGARLSIGLNTFYVLSVNAGTFTATVMGGQEGTTDADATSGSLVRVTPRFTDFEILRALNDDLADLSGPDNGLFRMLSADLTYSNSYIGYDLAGVSDVIDIYEVRSQAAGSMRDWPAIPKELWRLDRNADTGVFPSGLALQIFGGYAYPGLTVRVLYRSGFATLADLDADVAATGLPATAYDLPPLGATLRLAAPREIRRNFPEAQGNTRRAAEVPPGAMLSAFRGVAGQRALRVQAEAGRLVARYPDKRW